MFDQVHAMLTNLLIGVPDEDGAIARMVDATTWLGSQLTGVQVPAAADRQAALDGLHAAWGREPQRVASLVQAQRALAAQGGDALHLAGFLTAVIAAMSGDSPPREHALGDALQPHIDALLDAETVVRDAVVRDEIRDRVDAHMSGFKLPFRSGS